MIPDEISRGSRRSNDVGALAETAGAAEWSVGVLELWSNGGVNAMEFG